MCPFGVRHATEITNKDVSYSACKMDPDSQGEISYLLVVGGEEHGCSPQDSLLCLPGSQSIVIKVN